MPSGSTIKPIFGSYLPCVVLDELELEELEPEELELDDELLLGVDAAVVFALLLPV